MSRPSSASTRPAPQPRPTVARQLTGSGRPTRVLLTIALAFVVLGTAGTLLGDRRVDVEASTATTDLPSLPSSASEPEPRASDDAPTTRRPSGLDPAGFGPGQRTTLPPLPPGVPPILPPSTPAPDVDPPTGDPSTEPVSTAADPSVGPLVSPVAQGLGISFLAAFAVGVFSRVFLRMALAAAGVAVLLLLGLERTGIVDIHWSALESQGGGVVGWLRGQTESMRAFLTGSLPSGAAAATGFYLGFRRR